MSYFYQNRSGVEIRAELVPRADLARPAGHVSDKQVKCGKTAGCDYALDVSGADGEVAELERLAAENVKRVVRGDADDQSPWEIAGFLELKTVWHPIGV